MSHFEMKKLESFERSVKRIQERRYTVSGRELKERVEEGEKIMTDIQAWMADMMNNVQSKKEDVEKQKKEWEVSGEDEKGK